MLNKAREYYKNNGELVRECAKNRYKSLTEDKKKNKGLSKRISKKVS